MVYRLLKGRLHLMNLAVDPDYRRRGVGSRLVAELLAKLTQQRRTLLEFEVRETNRAAQEFFKSLGLRAVEVLHGFYEETGTTEDAYRFQHRIKQDDDGLDESSLSASLSSGGIE
jgi:ribosomal-protein-alanine N-acetyltransferase